MCFLLPHEVCSLLANYGDMQVLNDRAKLDSATLRHLQECEAKLGTDLLGLGLWSDGVPFSWERTESMETWAWFLPGVGSPKWKEARFPFTAFPTSCLAASTCDQILEVWAWSMECLLKGTFPATGPQGREFAGGDAWRRRRAGSPLGVQGVLCQIRGDWKAYKIVFKLPGWKDGLYRCWRCKAHPNTWTQTGIEAAMWRPRLRWQPWELLTVLKRPLSSVWTIPFMQPQLFKIDWLHTCDKGVALFFLGGIFKGVLHNRQFGHNQTERLAWLWRSIRTFYGENQVQDRVSRLTLSMVKNGLTSLGAAEVRALVPFGEVLTGLMAGHEGAGPVTLSVHEAMKHLHQCYKLLGRDFAEQVEAGEMLMHGLAFHHLIVTLHGVDPERWLLRPKHHMFLEMLGEKTRPSLYWTYREESFGGSLSRQGHTQGGKPSVTSMSRGVLSKFCARERVPRMLADPAP